MNEPEVGRLDVFQYVTVEKAECYRAVMRVFVAEKAERFGLYLRPREVAAELAEPVSRVLAEMQRVLCSGGVLMLSDLYLKNGVLACALSEEAGCLLHAAPLEETLTALERCGFELLHLADHSAALQQLAGQLIFDHGTLELFWQSFLDRPSAQHICQAVQARPPGYYGLVARKK